MHTKNRRGKNDLNVLIGNSISTINVSNKFPYYRKDG